MTDDEILAWMTDWVTANDYEFQSPLDDQLVTDVIDSSMDVVELTMDLEEMLDSEEEIDLEEIAPKFAALTFRQLAVELQRFTDSGA